MEDRGSHRVSVDPDLCPLWCSKPPLKLLSMFFQNFFQSVIVWRKLFDYGPIQLDFLVSVPPRKGRALPTYNQEQEGVFNPVITHIHRTFNYQQTVRTLCVEEVATQTYPLPVFHAAWVCTREIVCYPAAFCATRHGRISRCWRRDWNCLLRFQ